MIALAALAGVAGLIIWLAWPRKQKEIVYNGCPTMYFAADADPEEFDMVQFTERVVYEDQIHHG